MVIQVGKLECLLEEDEADDSQYWRGVNVCHQEQGRARQGKQDRWNVVMFRTWSWLHSTTRWEWKRGQCSRKFSKVLGSVWQQGL